MSKAWLYIQLFVVIILIFAGLALYIIMRRDPPPPIIDEDLEDPEPISPTDFVSMLRKREKEIRNEISNLDRDSLVDDINEHYD